LTFCRRSRCLLIPSRGSRYFCSNTSSLIGETESPHKMAERKSFDLSSKTASCFSKLRRGADLAPATLELKQTFALRRILLKHGQRTEEECSAVRKFLA
ncbi:unnamed protein product, partial [Ectocarpus fasciculatus]